MTVDVLYYFQLEREDNGYRLAKETKKDGSVMSINMREVVRVDVKDMTNSKEKGFSFKINVGDRIYHLQTESDLDRQSWVKALGRSMITGREIKNLNNIEVKKNLDLVIEGFAGGKSQKEQKEWLSKRVEQDIQTIQARFSVEGHLNMANFDDYTLYLNEIT